MGRRHSQDLRRDYQTAGAAAAHEALNQIGEPTQARVAAFFDIDNTVMRGASIFHLARGVAARRLFKPRQVADFAWKQLKFIASGSENLDDMKEATEAALAFVKGRQVQDVLQFAEEIFEERMIEKVWPGTLALAQSHIAQGHQVWLVSMTPVEVASMIASRLGLTGALGTVAEAIDGVYTGDLVGHPLHGPAKAEAVKALAVQEGLELEQCWAYSDSSNDIPMLSLVGHACAINPDRKLAAHAQRHAWNVRDYRSRKNLFRSRESKGTVGVSQ